MNIYEEIKLLNIERNCVRHADVCNRECDKCELVQDTDELLEMYDAVVKNLEKLKEYEDLDKQGKIVKLPCKVGDVVYGISMGKIISLTVNEISMFSLEGEKLINVKCQNNDEFRNYVEREFGKTVFSTKDEAEEKLKELRGGENER